MLRAVLTATVIVTKWDDFMTIQMPTHEPGTATAYFCKMHHTRELGVGPRATFDVMVMPSKFVEASRKSQFISCIMYFSLVGCFTFK